MSWWSDKEPFNEHNPEWCKYCDGGESKEECDKCCERHMRGEVMSDLIKREDAINLCEKWRNRTNEHHDKNGWYIADTLLKAIKDLPSADRPQGEWVRYMGDIWTCSACGESLMCDDIECNNYCPNCGCRMKGVDDE